MVDWTGKPPAGSLPARFVPQSVLLALRKLHLEKNPQLCPSRAQSTRLVVSRAQRSESGTKEWNCP
jgi:hypothetical protein